MSAFEPGDRVRADIPDESDPDFEWHGEHGTVVTILEDDANELTGDEGDGALCRINFEQADTQVDFRHRDLRLPLVE